VALKRPITERKLQDEAIEEMVVCGNLGTLDLYPIYWISKGKRSATVFLFSTLEAAFSFFSSLLNTLSATALPLGGRVSGQQLISLPGIGKYYLLQSFPGFADSFRKL
jgi:hypothetical protein